jgi:hypothetical protein
MLEGIEVASLRSGREQKSSDV